MEKLSKLSGGLYETASGFLAVVLVRASGHTDNVAWFQFKPTPLSDVIRVEWDNRGPIAVIDAEVAKTLLRIGYAVIPTEAQVDEYNSLVDGVDDASQGRGGDRVTQTLGDPDILQGTDDKRASQGNVGSSPVPPPPPAPASPSAADILAAAKKGK